MRLVFLAAAAGALLAGCATEAPYGPHGDGYGAGYYGPGYTYYDYGPYDYGPSYYAPGYLAFSYHDGDHWDHWNGGTHYWNGATHSWNGGTRSWQQGSVQAHPRASSRTYAQSHPSSRARVSRLGTTRGNEAARARAERQQPSHVASATHGPDRDHGT